MGKDWGRHHATPASQKLLELCSSQWWRQQGQSTKLVSGCGLRHGHDSPLGDPNFEIGVCMVIQISEMIQAESPLFSDSLKKMIIRQSFLTSTSASSSRAYV